MGLASPAVPEVNTTSAGSSGPRSAAGAGAAVEQALVRHGQHRSLEAGGGHSVRVALVGHHGARPDGLHPRAEIGRAQLLGAGLGHRADPPCGHHRVHPFGPVAHQRHEHVPAAHPGLDEASGQPRGAIGHLAERDLPALALAGQGHQGGPRRIGGVHHLAGEVHRRVLTRRAGAPRG